MDTAACLVASDEERAVIAELRALSGLRSDSDVLRLGLWHLARHFDLRLPGRIFCPLDYSKLARRKTQPASNQAGR